MNKNRITFVNILRQFLFLLLIPFTVQADIASDLSIYIDKIKNNVREKTLDNGLKVIVYERPDQPVFTSFLTVNVGGANEVDGNTGIAHVLEHMAFKGSKTLGTNDFESERKLMAEKELIYLNSDAGNKLSESQEAQLGVINQKLAELRIPEETVDKLYAQLGGVGLNATTSSDSTNYFVNLPLNAFEAWCQIESDRHLEPVWRNFYQERDVVLEERRLRYVDNVDGAFYQFLLDQSFDSHPYRRPVIGYVEDLKQLTMTKVDAFYKKHYGAQNITISIVGGLDADLVFRKIEKYFSKFPKGEKNIKPSSKEAKRQKTKRAKMSYPASPRLAFVVNKPHYPHPDSYALELWLETKLGSITSPMYKKLVLEDNIASSLEYFEAPGSAGDNLMIIMAKPAAGITLRELEKEILASLSQELSKGIDSSRFKSIKLNQVASFVKKLDSNSYLARGLATSDSLFNDWNYYFNWLGQLNTFKESDLDSIAKKYLDLNQMLIVYQEKGKKDA